MPDDKASDQRETYEHPVRHLPDGGIIRYQFQVKLPDGVTTYCYSKSVARRIAEQTSGEFIT